VAALGAHEGCPYSLSQIRRASLCAPDTECQVWLIIKVDRSGSLTCPFVHHLASKTLKVGKDSGVGDPASYELFADVVDL